MSALSIQPTFPIFTETNGLPLENGYIWIGAANLDPQGNPISVYWDAALTIQAAQPIRTLNGYPSRSGTPARIYVNSDYSIRVQDSKGSLVYSAPQATERYGNIINADGVVYDPAGVDAVTRTVQDKLREMVSVKDFGAVGDGLIDDSAAIQDAIDSVGNGGVVYFPPASYRISTQLQLNTKSRVSLVGNKSTIVHDENVGFLLILNCDNIEVTGFRFLGTFNSTTIYANNAEQGRIIPQSSTGVSIHENEWKRTSGAVFVQTGCNGLFFHHNRVIETHGGIQTSSAVFNNLWITDNYFLGHVFTNAIQGSDDQIAVFGSASGQVIISRNIIDKQGPTAFNQARAINIDVGSGDNSEIIVSENIVKNVVTTTVAQARAAINIEGNAALRALSRLTVKGNIITNCNIPIGIEVYASNILISENNISQSVVLGGFSGSGNGIQCNAAGLDVELIIKGNFIQQCGSSGINASSSNKIVIDGNFIKGSTSRGISLDSCLDSIISNNLVTGNQDGIFINNSQRLAVSGNTSVSNTRYGLVIQGATVSGAFSGNVLNLNTTANLNNTATTADIVFINNYGAGAIAISGTATTGRNLRGIGTFSASTTATVSFSNAEPDTNYYVALGAPSNNTFWVSNKTVNGFTLNCSASVSVTLDWILIR
jgi:parallel beta-helix repeat protein